MDEIEPALVGFSPQAGRDDDDVAGRNFAYFATVNALIRDEAGAVQQIERLPLGELSIRVDQANAGDDAATLEREGRGAADQTAAADDAYFHDCGLPSGIRSFEDFESPTHSDLPGLRFIPTPSMPPAPL